MTIKGGFSEELLCFAKILISGMIPFTGIDLEFFSAQVSILI